MKTNNWGDLVMTREEYQILKAKLNEYGVNLRWSVTDGKEYNCYIRNEYKQVVEGWGNELEKKLAKEFFERNER